MIVKCKGITIGKYSIPPFELNKGELLGIYLYGGEHFYDLEKELVALFTGVKRVPELEMNQNMEFVERFNESRFMRMFFPRTVQQYSNSNGKLGSKELKEIYKIGSFIKPKTKIYTLSTNYRKWLALFTTLSKSDKIIFDLIGQDPLGANKTIDIVKGYVEKGGAAILLDNFEDSETKCTKFIRVEING